MFVCVYCAMCVGVSRKLYLCEVDVHVCACLNMCICNTSVQV